MAKPRYYAAKSGIHGLGLFAGRRFDKGQKIGRFEGVRTKRDGTYVLWIYQEDGCALGIEGRNDLRFANHSSNPNAEFDGEDLYALRTIRVHEEITLHYGADWEDVP